MHFTQRNKIITDLIKKEDGLNIILISRMCNSKNYHLIMQY